MSDLSKRLRVRTVKVLPCPAELGPVFNPNGIHFPYALYNGARSWREGVVHMEPLERAG